MPANQAFPCKPIRRSFVIYFERQNDLTLRVSCMFQNCSFSGKNGEASSIPRRLHHSKIVNWHGRCDKLLRQRDLTRCRPLRYHYDEHHPRNRFGSE